MTTNPCRIDADLVIPGDADPFHDGSVVMTGPHITYVGPTAVAPATPDQAVVTATTVMPGMWDAHCHLFGNTTADLASVATGSRLVRAMRVGGDAHAALMAGFTSLREVGGLGIHLRQAIADGSVIGPNIHAAGSILSMTGGHGDIHALPHDFVTSHHVEELELCDGVPECIRAVRRQLRRGATIIKVCASGGVLSELDDPRHAQFSDDELRAIVEEAARADRIVAAHCHGKAGIIAALRCGVRTIEHGTYLDAEAARMMGDLGAILVSTRLIGEALVSAPPEMRLPEFAHRKILVTYAKGAEAMGHAIDAGVTIAAGTDILTSGAMWGRNGREPGLLVECGMTPLEAIRAATAHGPLTLGPQAPDSGRLAVGADADVITVAGDPLADIGLLADPSNVTAVWRSGGRVK